MHTEAFEASTAFTLRLFYLLLFLKVDCLAARLCACQLLEWLCL